MDLKEGRENGTSGKWGDLSNTTNPLSQGVGTISKRRSLKPIIAAVNGHAVGGGLEMILNCDIVLANHNAVFGYPEVCHGVTVSSGGPFRLI
jgi:enoyl-CoA hydratase/carnithine racemase